MHPKSNILVLSGSIRAQLRNRDALLRMAQEAADLEDYKDRIRGFFHAGGKLSNSEIIAGAALGGALAQGAEVDYFPMLHLFPPRDRRVIDYQADTEAINLTHIDTIDIEPTAFKELLDTLRDARGVILSSPVYFGDRSSVANKFLQIASVRHLLEDKVFGITSVGAKRNGGQETCNVFSLFEAVTQGALAVGNGPPTSQYGGTAVGGGVGHVLEDAWGLETAYGTGSRVSQVAQIFDRGAEPSADGAVRILLIVAIDTRDRLLASHMEKLSREVQARHPQAEIKIVNLIDHNIYRCLGCNKCPQHQDTATGEAYCAIRSAKDYMAEVRDSLRWADGFVVCGINIHDVEKIIFRYQVFTERLRFVRRNDFELTDKLVTGLCYHQFGAHLNPIHSMKTLVSYLRHNTVIHKPIEVHAKDDKILESGFEDLSRFLQRARSLKIGRSQVRFDKPEYRHFGEGSGYRPGDMD